MTRDIGERRRIANLAQAYQDGDISWPGFMASVGGGPWDRGADLLVDLIEHGPSQGSFTNINPAHFRVWNRQVDNLIAFLRR